jgi:hypothetical protein
LARQNGRGAGFVQSFALRAPYRLSEDHVTLRFDGVHYHIEWAKTVTPINSVVLQEIYATIDVSIFPHAPRLARDYHLRTPIDLDDLQFDPRASDGTPLSFYIRHYYSSRADIAIVLSARDGSKQLYIEPGKSERVTYSIRITPMQWGNYIRRHTQRPTDRVSLDLIFPRGLVSMSADHHFSGIQKPKSIPIQCDPTAELDTWRWHMADPAIDDSFFFTWKFADEREAKLQQNFIKSLSGDVGKVGNPVRLSDDGRQFRWFEYSFLLNARQIQSIKILYEMHLSDPDEWLEERRVLAKIGSQAERLSDVIRDRSEKAKRTGICPWRIAIERKKALVRIRPAK